MSDFYQLYDNLSANDFDILLKVRTFMEDKVKPIINEYWIKDEFPYHIVEEFKKLDICCKSRLLTGLIVMEMARIDPSMATFFNIQNGLVIGSVKDKPELVSQLAKFEKIGCFALTEPDVGSGTSDMKTTAWKKGDYWYLIGKKKWVGNSTWCDISIIWARDLDDNEIKGFIVDNKNTPGFSVEKIENKIALKVVQNGEITMKDCRIPEANRLAGGTGTFKDTKLVLRGTRHGSGWEITGTQMGAYENALKRSEERRVGK